jgi:hypothetical protein
MKVLLSVFVLVTVQANAWRHRRDGSVFAVHCEPAPLMPYLLGFLNVLKIQMQSLIPAPFCVCILMQHKHGAMYVQQGVTLILTGKGGKGRTGLMVACWLLFLGQGDGQHITTAEVTF